MSAAASVVPIRALGTDVDLAVSGHDVPWLEAALRERWHLCLRDADGSDADGSDADEGEGGAPLVVEATLLGESTGAPEVSTWRREDDAVRDTDPRRLLQRLTQSVTHAVIGARSGDLLMLHAAALAHPDTGATAVFVAPGNTGKTTLCRTLGPARTYVTDETVGISRDGTIDPYPKPLSVRRPDRPDAKEEQAPGGSGLCAPVPTPWLAGIVLLHRDMTHDGPPVVEDVDLFDAVIALTPESSAFMRTHRPLQWLADVLERTGGARRVRYAEVADLEPLAAEICARRSPW